MTIQLLFTFMRIQNIIFWVTTGIIFLFEGVLVAFTSQSEMAVSGITHLGYPVYFGTFLAVCKVLGSIALVTRKLPPSVREWTYAGFGIDFIAAFVSLLVVDGFGAGLILPLVFMGLLVASYRSDKQLRA